MRIIPIILFLLTLTMSTLAIAEKSDFDPDVNIRKKEENGKVIFSKSGFANKKSTKQHTPVVVTPTPSDNPTVELYYASWDPYSNKAIEYFRAKRIVVNAYDVDQDPKAAARKREIDPDFVGLPLVVINGIVIRGVDEKKYQEALATPIKRAQ